VNEDANVKVNNL